MKQSPDVSDTSIQKLQWPMQEYHIYYIWLLKYTIFSSMQPGHSFFYRKFAFKNCFIFKPWLSGCAEPGGTSTDSAFVADSASSWFARGEIWTCQRWPKRWRMIQTCSLNEMVKPKISDFYDLIFEMNWFLFGDVFATTICQLDAFIFILTWS